MRPIHFVLSVLVLAVVLSVVWFLAGETKRSQPATASAPSAAPDKSSSRAEDPSAPAATTNEPAPTNAQDRVATDVVSQTPAHAAARPAARTGVALTGEVRDAAGKPVANANVFASPGGDAFFAAMPLDLVGGRRASWIERQEAKTGADGRFELTGVKPGPAQLAVRASGYAPHDARGIDVPSGASHDVGVIELTASVIVDGRVVDSRGRGVAGAKIERIHEPTSGMLMFDGFRQPGVEVATTRADGSFTVDQLAAGAFKLRAATEDHPDKVEAGSASRPGEHVTLTIALDDGYEIAGRVSGVPAERQNGLRVRASPSRGDANASDFEFDMAFEGGETREALVKPDSTFVVRGLRESQSYALRARAPESEREPFTPALSPRVVARAGDRGVELTYQPEAALSFSVVDSRTRQPIEEFEVQAGIEWRMPLPRENGERANLHPGGQVRFGGLRPKSASDKASLEIQAVGYRKFEMENIVLVAGRDTDLGVLALDAVPVTRVTVLDDATGEPVAGARVTLRKAPEPAANAGFSMGRRVAMRVGQSASDEEEPDLGAFDDEDSVTGRTDSNGVAVLTSFEGARCQIDTSHADHAPQRSEVFTAAIAAPEEHTVRLRHGGAVRVTLKNGDGTPVAGGRVDHQRAGGDEEWEFVPSESSRYVTNSEGVVLFEHLGEGAHRFRPHDEGGNGVFGNGNMTFAIAGMPDSGDATWSEVAVTEGATAELALVAPTRVMLTGRVREAGEKLAGATVSLAPRSREGERGPRMPMMFGGGPSAKTDGAGHYELENVKAGEYTLSVSHPSRQMASEFEVTIADADKSFDVELSLATIEGRVLSPDGKPMSGARVSAERYDGSAAGRPQVVRMIAIAGNDGDSMMLGGEEGGAKPVLTDDEGRYALRGVLAGVELVVRAESKGAQPTRSEPVEVADNQVKRGVDLTLARAGKIEVNAFKSDGSPASMVIVTARGEDEALRSQEPKTAFIQNDGKATMEGLAPGKWRVSVRPIGPNSRSSSGSEPEAQVVEVKADEAATARFDLR